MPDSITRLTLEPGRHAALGAIAEAEGRYADAVRELWRADTTFDGPEGNCAVCLFDDIGWVWNTAGVPDSAIYYWEKFLAAPQVGRQGFDAFQRPFIVKRLGELYDATGDVTKAALRYREFAKLWERADPRLQPKVEDVRARISRLADIERR